MIFLSSNNLIEFDIDPIGKVRMVRSDAYKKRPIVTKYWSVKEVVKMIANKNKFTLPETFWLFSIKKMPDSWSAKKRLCMVNTPCKVKPDADNSLGSIMDFLCPKDQVIWDVRCTKIWGLKGKIIIKELDPCF